MHKMDEPIRGVIRKLWYPVWFIIKDESVDCTCVDFTTKQADCRCKKCLGLGKKIHLVRVRAAHQVDDLSIRGAGLGYSEKDVDSNYYTLDEVKAHESDLVVDGNEVDVIQRVYPERSNESDPVYYKYAATPKKNNYDAFLKLFREVLADAGY